MGERAGPVLVCDPPPQVLIVEHPNQEGNTNCCARTTELVAESVYGGDIQSIVTDH